MNTINLSKLRSLPIYKLPPTYRLGTPGMGCAGDPPGYPTYFIQPVYNQTGNTPSNAPNAVLRDGDTLRIVSPVWKSGDTHEKRQERENKLLAELYNPLPINHPRVRAWIEDHYKHFQHCYADDNQTATPFEYGRPGIVIYPVPDYKLPRHFRDDPRFSDEWRESEKAQTESANRQYLELCAEVATHDNHEAVRAIRDIYPDYEPELDLIDNPPGSTPTWWERLDTQPEPENCPGESWAKHPVNNNWCQFCGWHK